MLQALASDSLPVYVQREDYPKEFLPLFEELHIPCLNFEDMGNLDNIISDNRSHQYQALDPNATRTAEFICKVLN